MLNLSEQLNYYLAHCKVQKNLSAKTIKAYRIDLTQFFEFANGRDIDKDLVLKYLEKLQEYCQIRTVKRKFASIKAFFRWLEDEEKLEENIFHKIKFQPQIPKSLPRLIPTATVRQLLTYVYRQAESSPKQSQRIALRDAAVLEILFSTGIRVGELCALRPGDVDFKNRSLRIMGKGRKERIIQIGSIDVLTTLRNYQREYAAAIKKSGFYFVNRFGRRLTEDAVRDMLSRYCSRIHIRLHITPHMFRHTFATSLLDNGVDIRYIQHILGHSSIKITEIYTHVSSRKQRQILTRKNPRLKLNLPALTTFG